MKTYILLFRGINVGGKNLLPMEELKSLLESEGHENVKTYIQSGNVVVRSESLSVGEVSSRIEARHGFKPDLSVLKPRQLENAIRKNPYKSDAGKTVHFYFCASEPDLGNLNHAQLST